MTDYLATLCFALAFAQAALLGRMVSGRGWHLLGEIEGSVGAWALIYLGLSRVSQGSVGFGHLDFEEPLFVIAVMIICSAKPLTDAIDFAIARATSRPVLRAGLTLTAGPLLGSFITEPAAMVVTALVLRERVLAKESSDKLKYSCLALLFVNVSIGGVMTPFAAAPILMVAKPWGWDLAFTLRHFAPRAILACVATTAAVIGLNRLELCRAPAGGAAAAGRWPPTPLLALHLGLLCLTLANAHRPAWLLPVVLAHVALARATRSYQGASRAREALTVGLFLAGLVVLVPGQRWWIEPALRGLGSSSIYFGAMALTAVADNAALTYLGAQFDGLAAAARFALVAGAVVGGGLTVVANAPNPAGARLLRAHFGLAGIRAGRLLRAALLPTAIAAFCFYW